MASADPRQVLAYVCGDARCIAEFERAVANELRGLQPPAAHLWPVVIELGHSVASTHHAAIFVAEQDAGCARALAQAADKLIRARTDVACMLQVLDSWASVSARVVSAGEARFSFTAFGQGPELGEQTSQARGHFQQLCEQVYGVDLGRAYSLGLDLLAESRRLRRALPATPVGAVICAGPAVLDLIDAAIYRAGGARAIEQRVVVVDVQVPWPRVAAYKCEAGSLQNHHAWWLARSLARSQRPLSVEHPCSVLLHERESDGRSRIEVWHHGRREFDSGPAEATASHSGDPGAVALASACFATLARELMDPSSVPDVQDLIVRLRRSQTRDPQH